MNWRLLLSRKQIGTDGVKEGTAPGSRTVYERDWDRILFSNAFRRMHDKTQVFPMPEDDVVHSRLTHSLEAASVGRSLGTQAGLTIVARHGLEPDFRAADVGTIVAAASLAHDIGNPPFGHAGEDAIRLFFRDEGHESIADLSESEQFSLREFEGNAQGFRLLTRLQLEPYGGLRITAATLGAFVKYPRAAGPRSLYNEAHSGTKKHGFFPDDEVAFRTLATELGLLPLEKDHSWVRHPLTYLVEAADDICYSILDIEDGVRLGLVSIEQAEPVLKSLAEAGGALDASVLDKYTEPKDRVGYLRAIAIGTLVREYSDEFAKREPELLEGSYGLSLSKTIASAAKLDDLQTLARRTCYNAAAVLEIELAGYEALGGLLRQFVTAALRRPEGRSKRDEKSLTLLAQRRVVLDSQSRFGKILRVTDYVSGMTDRHALGTYRRLHGMALPGHVR